MKGQDSEDETAAASIFTHTQFHSLSQYRSTVAQRLS